MEYWKGTFAVFRECKTPKAAPDFVSYDKRGKISSRYWERENKKGKYIVRESDHWCRYSLAGRGSWRERCNRIKKCIWELRLINNMANERGMIAGKCYLSDFRGVTKKRRRQPKPLPSAL
jgi:hypothetical protein